MNKEQPVFITGGTGYMGTRLIRILLKEGYPVTALVRAGSADKLPNGAIPLVADPFNHHSYVDKIPINCIFIHLLGVAHPGPKKAAQFYSIDLASLKQSVEAAKKAAVYHFIYVSVAQTPTKIMAAYQDARAQAEKYISAAGLRSTCIRPWYVTGPGHYWPLIFLPVFKILEIIPSTSKKARSLALVSLKQMLTALRNAVIQPAPDTTRVVDISDIKKAK